MQKLTITHVRNWQENRQRVGYGHLYQGRNKSFRVETDEHFYQVTRYVERNALRANLVSRAEEWRWSSLWRRVYGGERGSGLAALRKGVRSINRVSCRAVRSSTTLGRSRGRSEDSRPSDAVVRCAQSP